MGKIFGVLGVIAVLVWAGVASAATLTVNQSGGGMYTSIQAAINAAFNGDIVEITDSATYNEGLRMAGNITLRSATGQKATIKPDVTYPGGQPAAIWLSGLESSGPTDAPVAGHNTVLENLIIDAKGLRTAIWVSNWYQIGNAHVPINWVAETQIKNCEIRNTAVSGSPQSSSGVYIGTDSVVIEDCNIHDCNYGVAAKPDSPNRGDGSVTRTANIHVLDTTVVDCNRGISIRPDEGANLALVGARGYDIVLDGVAVNGSFGIGWLEAVPVLVNNTDDVVINNCDFSDNAAEHGWSTLLLRYCDNSTVSNTTISGAQSTSGYPDAAMDIVICTDTQITNSNFLENGFAVRTYGSGSSNDVQIKDTVMAISGPLPWTGPKGVDVSDATDVTVDHCTIVGKNGQSNPINNVWAEDAAVAFAVRHSNGSITATNCIAASLSYLGAVTDSAISENISISNTAAYDLASKDPWYSLRCLLGRAFQTTDITGNLNDGGNYFCATEIDPEFYSTTPGAAGYLNLSCDTPLAILLGASDGLYMGALPVAGGPCDLSDDDAGDILADCAIGAGNHGEFVSCVADVANNLIEAGYLQGAGELVRQAARSSTGKPSTAGSKK